MNASEKTCLLKSTSPSDSVGLVHSDSQLDKIGDLHREYYLTCFSIRFPCTVWFLNLLLMIHLKLIALL